MTCLYSDDNIYKILYESYLLLFSIWFVQTVIMGPVQNATLLLTILLLSETHTHELRSTSYLNLKIIVWLWGTHIQITVEDSEKQLHIDTVMFIHIQVSSKVKELFSRVATAAYFHCVCKPK